MQSIYHLPFKVSHSACACTFIWNFHGFCSLFVFAVIVCHWGIYDRKFTMTNLCKKRFLTSHKLATNVILHNISWKPRIDSIFIQGRNLSPSCSWSKLDSPVQFRGGKWQQCGSWYSSLSEYCRYAISNIQIDRHTDGPRHTHACTHAHTHTHTHTHTLKCGVLSQVFTVALCVLWKNKRGWCVWCCWKGCARTEGGSVWQEGWGI